MLSSVLTIILYFGYMFTVFTENNNLYFVSLVLLIIAYNISVIVIDPDRIKKYCSENNKNKDKYKTFISGLITSEISTQREIKCYRDLFRLDNYSTKFLDYLYYILGLITPLYKHIGVKFGRCLTIGSFIILLILIVFKIIYIIKNQKPSTILQYLRRRHFELKYKDIISTKPSST